MVFDNETKPSSESSPTPGFPLPWSRQAATLAEPTIPSRFTATPTGKRGAPSSDRRRRPDIGDRMLRICFVATLALPLSACTLPAQCTTNVLVTYYSVSGHTRAMADAVAAGARSVEGAVVALLPIDSTTTEHLLTADAVIVGSPVYNGNVAPEVLTFMNGWPFLGGEMRDKVGAAFVTAGGISAGEEAALLGILRAMLVQGMVVVGGSDWWSAFGASAVTEEEPFMPQDGTVDPPFLAKARGLGRRATATTNLLTCSR
jgi:NAD(P)H dehydrogenase (quinone)